MKRFALGFCAGMAITLGAVYLDSVWKAGHHAAPTSDKQSAREQLPHSQWPKEWLRIEAFQDAAETCQEKIKTKVFNPQTVHWDANHPTQSYYEQVHVVEWYFDTTNDHGAKLYWKAVCNFDDKGELEDFTMTGRDHMPEIDD